MLLHKVYEAAHSPTTFYKYSGTDDYLDLAEYSLLVQNEIGAFQNHKSNKCLLL